MSRTKLMPLAAAAAAAVLAVCGWQDGRSRARAAAPEPPAADAAAEFRRAGDELARLFPALQDASRQLPRESFDPQAIIERVGRDPHALFAWVRDHTHWAPYRGALRGGAGVLMDRTGNSLDRSLLLAELLQSVGCNVRLARATLAADDDATAALLAQVRPVPADRFKADGVPPADTGADALAAIAQRHGIDAQSVRQSAERVGAEFAPAWDAARRRVADQMALLNDLPLRPSAAAAAADKAAAADAVAALRDHWWVQYETSGGTWTDLDVLLPETAPGKVVAPADKTIDLRGGNGHLPLPAEDCQEVVVRVVIERWEGGQLRRQPVLEHALRPAEVLAQPVVLRHVAPKWPADLARNPLAGGAAGLAKAAAAQAEWVPVLTVGNAVISKSSFDTAGTINENPDLDPTAKMGQTTGGLFGGLGGGLGGGGGKSDDGGGGGGGQTALTGEWLEFETRAPGRAPHVARHEVYDAIGPAARAAAAAGTAPPRPDTSAPEAAARRGLALLGNVGVYVIGGDVDPAYVVHLVAAQQLDTSEQWLALAREPSAEKRREAAANLAARVAPNGVLLHFALARAALSAARSDVYLDAPAIVCHRRAVAVDPGGAVVTREQIDVAANPAAARAGAADAFAARLAQGVADTVAEDLVLGPGLSGTPEQDNMENTAAVFAAAAAKGLKPLLVREPGDAAWRGLDLPPDVRARAEQDLADGYVLVAPAAAVDAGGATRRFGWWRVHARTGEAVGVMDNGYHADLTEDTVVRKKTAEQMLYDRIDMLSPRTGYRGWTTRGKTPHAIANEMGIKNASQELLCKICEMQELLIAFGI